MRTGVIAVVVLSIFLPVHAAAQQTAGAVAGTVRDSSGGVLPGVTVEIASPALIEKVRLATTDDGGQYRVTDLRPGVYLRDFYTYRLLDGQARRHRADDRFHGDRQRGPERRDLGGDNRGLRSVTGGRHAECGAAHGAHARCP